MRHINEVFEDKDFDMLVELKGKRSWRQFILDMSQKESKNN